MSTCILCLGQLRKGRSVKLAESVDECLTLGDAIRQQIQSNFLLPYTPSPSQLTCKTCFNAFQSFYKFLSKVKKNLTSFKSENSYEITQDFYQNFIPTNELMLKMEPQIIIPRIKVEPEYEYSDAIFEEEPQKMDTVEDEQQVEEKEEEKSGRDNRFDDDSDFAWSYDDPMDSSQDEDEKIDAKIDKNAEKGEKKDFEPEVEKTEANDAEVLSKRTRSHDGKSKETSEKSGTKSNKKPTKPVEKPTPNIKLSSRSTKSSKNLTESTKSNKKPPESSKKPAKKRDRRKPKSYLEVSTLEPEDLPQNLPATILKSLTTPITPENAKKVLKSEILAEPESSGSSDNSKIPDIKDFVDLGVKKEDAGTPIPIKPALSATGYMRYLPRSQITLEMFLSGQEYVVIDGVEYKIPKQRPHSTMKKNKKKKTVGFCYAENASRRQHPSNDPEGEKVIRSTVDIKCFVCGTEFESFFRLKKHFKLFHPNEKASLTCCGKQFYRRCNLLEHIEGHDRAEIYSCQICNKIYKSNTCLKIHMKFYHPEDDSEKVICYECGKLCNNESLLRQHMLTHASDTEKTFECFVCKGAKTFKSLFHVKKHLSSHHTRNKKNTLTVCHICSASVKESYLPYHMRTVHTDEQRERVNCEICGVWVLKATLKVHMAKHNDMGTTCKICNKFLKSSYSLTTHMKTAHNDNYKFKCEYCDKGFHRLVKKQEHVAVRHTREFLFKCRVAGCDRQFRAEANWRIHEKKAHPEEYDKHFKPFYKRDPKELQEYEEMVAGSGGQF